jgi:hypothetical protein
MLRNIEVETTIVAKFGVMAPLLDERARRLWAAAESVAIGYGGDALVSAATGLARETIRNGRRELAQGVEATTRIRRAGAGRPGIGHTQPGVKANPRLRQQSRYSDRSLITTSEISAVEARNRVPDAPASAVQVTRHSAVPGREIIRT